MAKVKCENCSEPHNKDDLINGLCEGCDEALKDAQELGKILDEDERKYQDFDYSMNY